MTAGKTFHGKAGGAEPAYRAQGADSDGGAEQRRAEQAFGASVQEIAATR